jgi:membrane protein YdbS with pleckstrin-like domain/uncharacterized Zn finger protein (UPF0148 family)
MRVILDADEKILYEKRRHLLYLFVGVGIVFGISYVSILLFKSKLVFLIGGSAVVYVFLDWWKNVWYITNKRLIEEEGVIVKSVKETPLEKINNVTYQKDPLGMIFNYGTVYVESAAKDGMTMMKMMPNPEEFLRKISEAKNAFLATDLMECPICKEVIKKGALLCRFCGADLSGLYKVEEQKTERAEAWKRKKEEVILEGKEVIEERFVERNEMVEDRKNKENIVEVKEDKENIYRRKVEIGLFCCKRGGRE